MAINEEQILQKAKQELMEIPGVVGVGMTHSTVTKLGNEYQISVYIDSEKVIPLLPSFIDTVPVVYKVSGTAEIHAFAFTRDAKIPKKRLSSLQTDAGKFRPLIGGISGGLYNSQMSITGTLGCFVKDSQGRTVILSNNHVMAWDIGTSSDMPYRGNVGDPIIQPGEFDGGTIDDKVVTLEKSINIAKNGSMIDASYSSPLSSFNEPNACNLYTNESITPTLGMLMKKAGRTTDCVEGKVESIGATITVNYTIHTGTGDLTFPATLDDLFTVQNPTGAPASKEGDSGSAWVTATGNNAVGLNFAGTGDGTSISCKATNIENILGVKFGLGQITTYCSDKGTPFVSISIT